MKSTKIYQLFATFSSEEVNQFKKFLNSPFHNENKRMIKLYSVLNDAIKGNKNLDTKNKLWKKVFTDKNYNDGHLRTQLSFLLKLGETFLYHHHIKDKEMDVSIFLSNILIQRGLNKHYAQYERKIMMQIARSPRNDEETKRKELEFQILSKRSELGEDDNRLKKYLDRIHKCTDEIFILNKLRYLCEAINDEKILNFKIEKGIDQEILDFLPQSSYFNEEGIQIYYYIYQYQKNGCCLSKFKTLIKLIKNNYDSFSVEEAIEIYIFIQNIGFVEINKGLSDFLDAMFYVYNDIIELNLIRNLGYLSDGMYNNIIQVALVTKNYTFAEEFIENYIDILTPKFFKNNAYHLGLAKLRFVQKQYHQTIFHLSKIERTTKYRYEIDVRKLLLQTYYELKEFSAFNSLLLSFKIFILRSRHITKNRKKQSVNGLKLIQRVADLASDQKDKIMKIKHEIIDGKHTISSDTKRWLLEKLEEKLID